MATPQSTVSAPTPLPTGLPTAPTDYNQGRDLARERTRLEEMGVDASVAGTLNQKKLLEATYTPQELAGIPYYEYIAQRDKYKDATAQGLAPGGNIPAPTASVLRPLEQALRVKQEIGNQPLGESEAFQKAGLDPYMTLSQSLQQHSKDIDYRYSSFANTMGRVGDSLRDTYNSALTGYKMASDEYNAELARLDAIVEKQKDYENAIKQLEKRNELDKELYSWQQKVAAEYEADAKPTPAQLLNAAESGYTWDGQENDWVIENGFTDFARSLGTVTQDFSTPANYIAGRSTHGGYDIAGKENAPIPAFIGGKVISVEKSKGKTGWGNSVVVQDAQGNKHRYAHMSGVNVKVGDEIGTGDVLGGMGNTGKSTGTHLHYEILDSNGKLVDPRKVKATEKVDEEFIGKLVENVKSGSLTLAQAKDRISQEQGLTKSQIKEYQAQLVDRATDMSENMRFDEVVPSARFLPEEIKGKEGSVPANKVVVMGLIRHTTNMQKIANSVKGLDRSVAISSLKNSLSKQFKTSLTKEDIEMIYDALPKPE